MFYVKNFFTPISRVADKILFFCAKIRTLVKIIISTRFTKRQQKVNKAKKQKSYQAYPIYAITKNYRETVIRKLHFFTIIKSSLINLNNWISESGILAKKLCLWYNYNQTCFVTGFPEPNSVDKRASRKRESPWRRWTSSTAQSWSAAFEKRPSIRLQL